MGFEADDGTAAIYREPAPPQKSCSGYRIYKILSIIYAIFFFLVGALLLAIGVWVVVIKSDYESIHDVLTSPSILAITVGIIMVATAIIGVVGSAASKLWPLRIFLGIVIVVFIIQVVIGIVAFVYREQTIDEIDQHLTFAIEKYTSNKQVTFAVNKVQTKFGCCGLNNLTDWTKNRVYACSSGLREACHVPDSCCKTQFEGCGLRVVTTATSTQLEQRDIYTRGCRWQFLAWLENNLDVVGATALGFAILHILGIFVVYMFITKVEDRYRLFKYRKRYYPN